MKILKYYEDHIGNDWEKLSKYKLGDLVLTKFNGVVEITDIDRFIHNKKFQYGCLTDDNKSSGEFIYILEDYIIKKLTDEEIELYKVSKKFNL